MGKAVSVEGVQKHKTLKEKRLQAAWKAAEQAVELIDWAHVRRYGIEGLGPLRNKKELYEDVTVSVMASTEGIDREMVKKMAVSLVDAEWAKAMEV